MSTFTKPMPLAWQNKPASSDYAATQALGVNETDADRVYARAVQLGRFRFGWSVRQCDFLKTEAEQWTGSACLALGEDIVGIRVYSLGAATLGAGGTVPFSARAN